MRTLILLSVALFACSGASGATEAAPTRSSTPTPSAAPTRAVTLSCEPTRTKDASGVITTDGRVGIVGEPFTFGEDMNGAFWLVRRGAIAGDSLALRFEHVAGTAPASWVAYSVSASAVTTPWGDAAFKVGWKPISFPDNCWRLVADGADTGLVVAIGH